MEVMDFIKEGISQSSPHIVLKLGNGERQLHLLGDRSPHRPSAQSEETIV